MGLDAEASKAEHSGDGGCFSSTHSEEEECYEQLCFPVEEILVIFNWFHPLNQFEPLCFFVFFCMHY